MGVWAIRNGDEITYPFMHPKSIYFAAHPGFRPYWLNLNKEKSSHSQLCCGCEDTKSTEPVAHLRPKKYKLFLTEPIT